MKNLVCFKHPEYRGDTTPELSCKVCCGIYIAEVKDQNASAKAPLAPRDWLAEKARQAQVTIAVGHVSP